MISLDKIKNLKKHIEKGPRHITSEKLKDEIYNLYGEKELKKIDIPRGDKIQLKYNRVCNLLNKLYELSKRTWFPKKDTLRKIREIENSVKEINIYHAQRGITFKEDFKEDIFSILKEKKLSHVVEILKDAEKNITSNPKNSCDDSREAIEEVFRKIREKYENKEIKRGTLGEHAASLERLSKISSVEKQFFVSGVYGFLSEKGKHANKEIKKSADASLGFKLVLISIEYLLNKKLL